MYIIEQGPYCIIWDQKIKSFSSSVCDTGYQFSLLQFLILKMEIYLGFQCCYKIKFNHVNTIICKLCSVVYLQEVFKNIKWKSLREYIFIDWPLGKRQCQSLFMLSHLLIIASYKGECYLLFSGEDIKTQRNIICWPRLMQADFLENDGHHVYCG